ncbi:MAG: hypothetical protein GW903_09570 [Alphaproteobacteria bacterium]|nr:hypothetical protein [Alphaproteobacteria bacterium]NCQ89206.1 hypothetical protein [Alphaproteobacteria bacterium]NCT08118.1 hypothetical protein [Alphaproteobacteria bacterium]
MMKNLNLKLATVLSVFVLGACTQTTPSMMNTQKPLLVNETIIEQVALNDLSDDMLESLAARYSKNGTGPLELTMAFDPTSKSFTAMSAVQKLQSIKTVLAHKGVRDVVTETLSIKGAQPALMVSYDSLRAQGPQGCKMIPGLDNNETSRFLGDYQFGCGTETMMARQIANPADLQGNDGLGPRSGRREANILNGYENGAPREPLVVLGRENLTTE